VVTFFDADAAGRKAAERAEELLEPTGSVAWGVNRSGGFEAPGTLRVKVALLPGGHDPDTFLRAEGAEAFAERIAAAKSLLSYALDRALQDDGTSGPRTRAHAFARAALLLAKVTDGEEATALSREAARKLGVDSTQLWIESQRLQASLRRPTPAPPASSRGGTPALPTSTTRERDLVTLLLHSVTARSTLLAMVEDAEIRHDGLRAIVGALKRRPHDAPETLMAELPDDAARGLLAALLVEERAGDPGDALIQQFRTHLDREQRLRRQRALSRSVAEAPAAGAETSVTEALRSLHDESKAVYEIAGGVAQSLTEGTARSARSSDA
jgi:DNA primase